MQYKIKCDYPSTKEDIIRSLHTEYLRYYQWWVPHRASKGTRHGESSNTSFKPTTQ